MATALGMALLIGGCADLSTDVSRQPASIGVDPESITLTEGDTAAVAVTVRSEAGDIIEIPAWVPPVWNSGDRLVMRADGDVLEAVGPGETWAEVTFGGLRTTIDARVNPATLPISVLAYLNQSIQRQDGGVPLVAGRDALLRVFVTTERTNFLTIDGTARFFADGVEVHTLPLELQSDPIPSEVSEFSLGRSLNALVPGAVIRPGLSMVLELDPDHALPVTSPRRYPADGTAPLDVREAPPLELRLVPVRLPGGFEPDMSPMGIERALSLTRAVFPLSEIRLEIGEVYETDQDLTTTEGWSGLLNEVRVLREVDGSDAYFYGIIELPPGSRLGGLAYLGSRISIGSTYWGTVAHELGHNFSLPHAPCGVSGDPNYPYAGASIGHYGYDLATGALRSPWEYVDLMSYCDPEWISDYNYLRVLQYRDINDWAEAPGSMAAAAREPALVAWGTVSGAGIELEPALVLDMPPRSATTDEGRYRLHGYDGAGAELFRVAFEPRETSRDGVGGFMVTVPASIARPDRLERLVVTGPAGVAERRASAAGAAQIRISAAGTGRVRATWQPDEHRLVAAIDGETGRLLALDRDGVLTLPDAVAANAVLLVSDGVRTRPATVRR